MSQRVDFDEEWDVDEQTYILYEYTTTERTTDFGTDYKTDETYEKTEVSDVTDRTAYFKVEYLECESDGAPENGPEFYLRQLLQQDGTLYEEYDLHTEMDTFHATVFNDQDDELVVVHFRQFN